MMGFPLFHGIPNPLLIHGKLVNELTETGYIKPPISKTMIENDKCTKPSTNIPNIDQYCLS